MTYTGKNLKLLRGKKMDEELQRLSDKQDDFNFRRLFVEETEKTLHVIESRQIVSNYIAWGFFALAVLFHTPLVSLYLVITSLFFKVVSDLFKRSYNKKSEGYQFNLTIVDSVIMQDYGISMK